MNLIKKNTPLTISLYLLVISMIWTYSYFVWPTFANGGMYLLHSVFYYGSIILLGVTQLDRLRKISLGDAMTLIFLSLFVIHENFVTLYSDQLRVPADFLMIILVFLLFHLDDEELSLLFNIFMKAFIIISLPSIIYFVIRSIGISLPHSILYSAEEGKNLYSVYYERYFLGLISVKGVSVRPCGVFNEPGVIGTISALLFAASYKKVNKVWSILLIIEGVFSLSLAFYFIMIIFIITRAFQEGMIKIVCVLSTVLIALIIFFNVEWSNPVLSSIQSRFDMSTKLIFIDNRTTSGFDISFNNFIHSGGKPVVFGYGKGAYSLDPLMAGSCSYKCLLYDYGILGCLWFILYLFTQFVRHQITRAGLPFIIVFIVSLYQRPYVINILYLPLLISALAFLNHDRKTI